MENQMMKKPKRRQIHVDVDETLFQAFHKVLPARGMKTELIRRMIRIYLEKEGSYNPLENGGPLDSAIEEIIELDKQRGLI